MRRAAGDRLPQRRGKPARRPRRNLELLQDLFERIGLPLDIAGFQAAFYKLVGPDHPDARRAGTAAGDWIRAVGTHHLRTVLADGLPTNAAASETA